MIIYPVRIYHAEPAEASLIEKMPLAVRFFSFVRKSAHCIQNDRLGFHPKSQNIGTVMVSVDQKKAHTNGYQLFEILSKELLRRNKFRMTQLMFLNR